MTFGEPVWAYQRAQNATTEAALRPVLEIDAIRWQYMTGVDDVTMLDPDSWEHEHALVSRPGNGAAQLALFRDYASNVAVYPQVHEHFRASQVPLLAVWGKGDEILSPDGARAFSRDLPHAEVHLLPGGHFLFESAIDQVADLIRPFWPRQRRGEPATFQQRRVSKHCGRWRL